jgi:hypothetical protein
LTRHVTSEVMLLAGPGSHRQERRVRRNLRGLGRRDLLEDLQRLPQTALSLGGAADGKVAAAQAGSACASSQVLPIR